MKLNNSLGYAIIIFLLIITSVVSMNLFLYEKTSHDRLNIHALPLIIGDWKGTDIEPTEKEYKILETRNLILRKYSNPSNVEIFLFIIYSETNRSVFHPPEVCLIGSGTLIEDKSVEKISFDRYSFSANKLCLRKGAYKEIALYCYKAGDFYTANYYLQQARLAVHQIFGKTEPGATILVSMSEDGGDKMTLETLKEFLSEAIKALDSLSSRACPHNSTPILKMYNSRKLPV